MKNIPRRFSLLACIFLLGVARAAAQPGADATAKQLLKIEQALLDSIAPANKGIWDRFMHDSCIVVIEDGSTQTKHEFLDAMNPLPPGYDGYIRLMEPRIQFHGNTAVLSFVDDEYLELFGQKIHTQYRQTDTWIKNDGEWKMISMQVFEIPKNPPPSPVDSGLLREYVGLYVLAPGRVCSISLKDGQLYMRKGSGKELRLGAETETVFFKEGDGRVNVIFRRSAEGSYDLMERREGEDVVWKRLKENR